MTAPTCLLCGRRASTYVCQDCGKTVCNNCFDPIHWSCTECQAKLRSSAQAGLEIRPQLSLGTWLFFVAFAIIVIGMVLLTLGSISQTGGVSGGAVILIGPIPIVLGAGPYSSALVVIALVLTAVSLLLFFVLRKRG